MRLFLAIDLPDTLLLRLGRLVNSLRPEAMIKWSPVENFHITTKFIGSFPEERLEELTAALSAMPRRAPFHIHMKGFGWFPNDRQPRVLWAGVEQCESLKSLVNDTEDALAEIGIAREKRLFSPHLTLARVPYSVPLGRLKERIEDLRDADIGSYVVSRFCLYRSDSGLNASVYRRLHEFEIPAAMTAVGTGE